MAGAPPSLRLYALAKAVPGILGTFSPLDEHPALLAEWQAYAAAQGQHEREEATRRKRNGPRVAGHRR